MPIHLLNQDTIGKIAAGEVIERPASVVKELLENALDAGASAIEIAIEEGGSRLIQVTDDGCGMSVDELALAVQRHATSKLTSFDDLDRLHTLGFRGEALPSVAAVAQVSVRSAPDGASSGAELSVTFGTVGSTKAVGTRAGTTVTVRDLFENVPARRKFLRQTGTETTYIARIVGAYACAYPAIRFSLVVDGRRSFATDGSGDHHAAAIAVMGHELVDDLLLLRPLGGDMAVPGVAASGWVSTPRVTRSHRQNLFCFVNGRLITHRSLAYALEEAYHSLIMVGRHPIAVVCIDVDPAEVDVNVHPTKAEVKFHDERGVARAVQRATHQALLGQAQDVLPVMRIGSPEGPRQFVRQQPALTFDDISTQPEQAPTELPDEQPVVFRHRSGLPVLRVLGQVGGTYIIAEGPEGMYLIDQHAAHERVMYEKILAQMRANAVDRQPLLDPLIVELSPGELTAYDRSQDELNRIGFEVERFGPGAIAIRAKPALVQHVDLAERMHEILIELAEGGAGDSWLDSVAISAACHTAIRAGQHLSLPEMRELVAQLEQTDQPRACGHGRPTMLHMSQLDLEKQFARR